MIPRSFISLTSALLLMASSAFALGNYDLISSAGTHITGNTTSSFYEISGAGVESGTAAALYSATLGGNDTAGFWVKISFDGNPQPVLTSAYLKAAHGYLWWDSADLSSFNSGTYTSITLWNSGSGGIQNQNEKYQGTSHAGLNGSPGEEKVPDSGATLALLALSLSALGMAFRRTR